MSWLDRARSKTVVTPAGCWEFTGAKHNKGYGCIAEGGGVKHLHRLAAEAFLADFRPELMVMHICDNPPCWNPDHLIQGTAADNTADMVAKGRFNSKRKLTLEQEASVRARALAGAEHGALANEFGVSAASITRIKRESDAFVDGRKLRWQR